MHNNYNNMLKLSFRLFDYGPPEDSEECWERTLSSGENGAEIKILRPEEQLNKNHYVMAYPGFFEDGTSNGHWTHSF